MGAIQLMQNMPDEFSPEQSFIIVEADICLYTDLIIVLVVKKKCICSSTFTENEISKQV